MREKGSRAGPVHPAVDEVAGNAIDFFIARVQSGAGFFSRYRLRNVAGQVFFLTAVFSRFNISLAGPGDGVPAFFPGVVNGFVAFGATFGLRSFQKVGCPHQLKNRFWDPLKLLVNEKIDDCDSGNSKTAHSDEKV